MLVTVAVAIFYSLPGQSIEIYRAIAQDIIIRQHYIVRYRELVVAALGMLALGFCIWYVAALLLARLRYRIECDTRTANIISLAVPAVFMAATFAAAVFGILRAMTEEPSVGVSAAVRPSLYEMLRFDTKFGGNVESANLILDEWIKLLFQFNHKLALCGWALIGIGAAAVGGVTLVAYRRPFKTSHSADDVRGFLGFRIRAAVYGCIALAVGAFTFLPLAIPVMLGPLGVATLFFMCVTLLSGQLSFLADRHGIPYLTLLIVVAGVVALLDLNDNHRVLSLADGTSSTSGATKAAFEVETPPELEEKFKVWYDSRKDPKRYKRYPIYVVAAEGGGIHAALHAATVLSRLQDQCPDFARHLFGISGVSGGSLGAAVFAGLASLTADSSISAMETQKRGACLPKKPLPYKEIGAMPLVSAADTVLSDDLLSPVLAGLLFTDFLQSFLPVPVPLLDRGRRLDMGFEAAMARALEEYRPEFGAKWKHKRNPLADRLRDWDPKGNAPALLMNTTEVETGRRRVLAPFVFEGAGLTFFPLWDEAGNGMEARAMQVSVATAASLSARFSWVTPAAWFQDFQRNKDTGKPPLPEAGRRPALAPPIRLVDGGYFENSGVATAVELVRAMERAAKKNGFADEIQISLIVLVRGTYPQGGFGGLKELLSPVEALMNTRSARGYVTIADAEREFKNAAGDARVRSARLVDLNHPLPLGWRLSTITSLLIRAQAGNAGACNDGTSIAAPSGADCVLETVQQQLSPDATGKASQP